jgi:hypothetical protein
MLLPFLVAIALGSAAASPIATHVVDKTVRDDDDGVPGWQRGVLAVLAPSDDGAPLYADGGDCAIRLCCASGFIAARAIDSCTLLSNEGKAIALLIALGSGVTGLAFGAALAFAVYGSIVTPSSSGTSVLYRQQIEVVTTIVFGLGALFTLVGTVVGIGAALLIDHACVLPGKALFRSMDGRGRRRFLFRAVADDAETREHATAPLTDPASADDVSY